MEPNKRMLSFNVVFIVAVFLYSLWDYARVFWEN